MQKTITIYDIATEAKVSAATVSRVLANSAGVKPEKYERVMQVVNKYHFRPNALAKGLSQTHSKMIGMLCPDVRNPYYSNVFVECEKAASENGYTLVLNNTFAREDLEIAFIQKMMEQRVESLIICGGVADWRPLPDAYSRTLQLCAAQIPVVATGRLPIENCSRVCEDHVNGMRQAIEYLQSLGHRKIAFLHGFKNIYQTQVKIEAFRNIMEEFGLPMREEYLVDAGSFDEHGGVYGMNRLLALPDQPTAVVAINDMMAVGTLQAILQLGYSVPENYSLIGFDDIDLTELINPHINSIHFDYRAMGQALIGAAVGAINGETEKKDVILPTRLVIRDSCRKL